ncbi:MAG: flagellar protein FlgN [Herminiimonas sp.]|jgi:flagella synthesis protein FlgN|nr:flagellar protein FlgN [Herminiimonas sp.]
MHSSGTGPASTLGDELGAARDLLQCLRQEQAQLIEADIEALGSLTVRKAALVARMAELAQLRHKALGAAGFPAEEAGMQAWLDAAGQHNVAAAAGKSWAELLDMARSGKELNRTNGLLIGTRMAHNQKILNAMRGTAQSENFYGPDGQHSTKTAARGLVVG